MTTALRIDDLEVGGRRVLVRSDLNVPLKDGEVADDFRIQAAIPTIEALRSRGAIVAVCSHLGRPDGPDPALKMDPIARRLGELGGFDVAKADDVAGPQALAALEAAGTGDVVVLENTRFEPGEKTNSPELSKALAGLADAFVNDAFGSAHRAHASTTGVAEHVISAAGDLLWSEVEAMDQLLGDPGRPYVVAMGGAKVSDKLGAIRALLPLVDAMLVGGGMCFTLMAAESYEVGDSLVEESMLGEVREVLESEEGGKIMLPVDVVVAASFTADADHQTVAADRIPKAGVGVDIGPQTTERFSGVIGNAESVFWNGPMGVFEWEPFRAGTTGVARAVADCSGHTVVGGGDSVAALRVLGLESEVDHLSTGGGAGLEMLEGKALPGVVALERWVDGA